MTRKEALQEARRRWGPETANAKCNAWCIGETRLISNGRIKSKFRGGVGKTWEEALANAAERERSTEHEPATMKELKAEVKRLRELLKARGML